MTKGEFDAYIAPTRDPQTGKITNYGLSQLDFKLRYRLIEYLIKHKLPVYRALTDDCHKPLLSRNAYTVETHFPDRLPSYMTEIMFTALAPKQPHRKPGSPETLADIARIYKKRKP